MIKWLINLMHINPDYEGRKRLLPGQVPQCDWYPAALPLTVKDKLHMMDETRKTNDRRLVVAGLKRAVK